MQTILGANGTIGSVLAKKLTAYTDKIRLVSRNPKKVNDTDELFPADLSDPRNVDPAVAGSEIVYLVVGLEYNLKIWQDKWPKLMQATIDACKKYNAKLVFFDNVYMYDAKEIPHMTENSQINPPSKKGLVRKQIADMILDEVKAGKLTALIARSADFYGPDNENSFVYNLVYKNLQKGKKPNWIINADKKHSFTFTPDAAKATALLGNTPDAYNQVWHLPTAKNPITGREMIDLYKKELKYEKRGITIVPKWMLRILGLFIPLMREMPEMMYQYKQDYFFDSSKFDNRFDFKTTSYEEGVRWTIYLTKTEFKRKSQPAKLVLAGQG
jgi:nucleoside-diphosphate-sugar epimerase